MAFPRRMQHFVDARAMLNRYAGTQRVAPCQQPPALTLSSSFLLFYMEQFDVQSAELTIRETIEFSAQLRLEKTSPVYSTPDGLRKHVDDIINTLELTEEADYLVGSKEAGGLSIEQTKRLSIAVELAASPSIIFLDEPTSGEITV